MARSAPMSVRARTALARMAKAAAGLRPATLLRALPWVIVLGAFEAWGRYSSSDGMDSAALLGLVLVLVWVQGRHGDTLQRLWSTRLRSKALLMVAPWRLECGLDLRGRSALPQGHPRAWALSWLALIAGTVVLALTASRWPGGARSTLQGISGLLSLIALGCLWGALITGALIACELVAGLLRERVLGMETRHRTLIAWALFTGGVGCMALPLSGCVMAIACMGLCMGLIDLLLRPRIGILWRPSGGDQASVRSAPRPVWSAAASSAIAALACALILLASGDRIAETNSAATALTGLWGTAFAKLATFAFGVCYTAAVLRLLLGRWRDPARHRPVRVHVQGAPRELQRVLRSRLRAAGLLASFHGEPKACAAIVRIDANADPFGLQLERQWPLPLASGHLDNPRAHEILRRRVQVLCRRGIYTGLRRLWRAAGSRTYAQGSGFWIEPHLWYVPTMTRDDEASPWTSIAPAYHQVFSGPARRHLFELLRDLEVDRIFVEDGVGHRKLVRVFAGLFGYHDRFGSCPLEIERLVGKVHGVRMILHDYTLGGAHGVEDYPEPEYQTLGRARILHVFRDRGGDDEKVLIPDSFDYLPLPQLT